MKCKRCFLWVHGIWFCIIFFLCVKYSVGSSLEKETKSKRYLHNRKTNGPGDVRSVRHLYEIKNGEKLGIFPHPEGNEISADRLPIFHATDRLKYKKTVSDLPSVPLRKTLEYDHPIQDKIYLAKFRTRKADESSVNDFKRRPNIMKSKSYHEAKSLRRDNIPKMGHQNPFRRTHAHGLNLKDPNRGKHEFSKNVQLQLQQLVMKSNAGIKSPLEIRKRFIQLDDSSPADSQIKAVKSKRTDLIINHPLVELNIYGPKPTDKSNNNSSTTVSANSSPYTTAEWVENYTQNTLTRNKAVPGMTNSNVITKELNITKEIAANIMTSTVVPSPLERGSKIFSISSRESGQPLAWRRNANWANIGQRDGLASQTETEEKEVDQLLQQKVVKNMAAHEREEKRKLVADQLLDMLLKDRVTSSGDDDASAADGGPAKDFRVSPRTKDEAYNSASVTEPVRSLEDDMQDDSGTLFGDDFDDASVSFGARCDYRDRNVCWFDRETGDSLTLSLNISSAVKEDAFNIRWRRVFKKKDRAPGLALDVRQDRSPWNVVLGNGGRELRLNPITDSDMDPNFFVAKVFGQVNRKGQRVGHLLKQLTYRISILPIDMGLVYSGEELNMNVENFISLPERGDLSFTWVVERSSRGQGDPLPSNMKVSQSGRSVVVKELRRERGGGPLSCTVFSATGVAVARRRFHIQTTATVADVVFKRSPESPSLPPPHPRRRTDRCPPPGQRWKSYGMRSSKKISRIKRYRGKKMLADSEFKDCYRGIRRRDKVLSSGRGARSILLLGLSGGSLPGSPDSRLTSLDQLIEESQKGDGTLDDVIPRETHYILPEIVLVTGDPPDDKIERSEDRPSFLANCTTDFDCGPKAFCVIPKGRDGGYVRHLTEGHVGYCYCRPEFFGDGFRCFRIEQNHREKRIRRDSSEGFDVDDSATATTTTAKAGWQGDGPEFAASPPELTIPEEVEEAYLVSSCLTAADCSSHANCESPLLDHGHLFCRCRNGFHGNGVFCWEIVD